MRACITGLLLLAASLLVVSRAGAQSLSFSVPPTSVTGTYSPDTGLTVASTMSIRHSGTACSYFVTFSAGSSGSFAARTASNGASTLAYQVYDNMTNQNVLEDLSATPSAANVLSASSPSGNKTQVLTFTSYVAPGQLPAPGTYADSITMNIYIGTLASHGASVATYTFSVSLTLPTLLDIAIVPTGSPFNVANTSTTFNFGALSSGQVQSADFMVRSNYLNTIALTSTNGEVLLNGITGDTSSIPYSLSFNGSPVTLPQGSPVNVVASQPATSSSGRRYPMSVTIGTVGFVSAATYSDIITFTATAN